MMDGLPFSLSGGGDTASATGGTAATGDFIVNPPKNTAPIPLQNNIPTVLYIGAGVLILLALMRALKK